MNKNFLEQLQISGNIKYSSHSGTSLNASVDNLFKLSPTSVIVIGSLIAVFGFYLYCQQKDKNKT
jgi:hypothetical protein